MDERLTQGVHRALAQRPNQLASVFGERRQTWAQLADRVARFGGVLQKLGMQRTDRVGMLAINSDRWLDFMFGTWWAGGALNPVNIRWSAAEIAFSLDDCETKILLVDEKFAPLVPELRARSKSLTTVVYSGEGPAPEGTLSLEALLAETPPVPDVAAGGEDLAGVFYTGGTTGYPKGVMLSHASLMYNGMACLLELPYHDDEVVLASPPLFHQAGMCIVLRCFIRTSRMVIIPNYTPLEIMAAVQKERCTFTLLVPTMIQLVVDHPEVGNYDLSSLTRVLYGASPITDGLLERAFVRLPSASFIQGYGMTETSGPYTVLPSRYHTPEGRTPDRLRSCGRPVHGMDLRVVDPDGNDVPRGTIGEIISRGPALMQGYWKRPEETAAALKDGWMHSGDAGFLDDEGFVFICDRVKDMIVSGGENVYSSEVENAISRHPDVALCAVVGIPSERWGEAVHAIVVRRTGSELSAADLRAFCKTLIAGYKCPGTVDFRESLPLSAAGKPRKDLLREELWKGHTRRVS
jgi:long-chain acyl-CoA synthetase